jgi:peroxiredoxin
MHFALPELPRDPRRRWRRASLTLLSGLWDGFARLFARESGIARPVSPKVEPIVIACLLVRTVAVLQARFAAFALVCLLVPLASVAAEPYELIGQPAPDLVARDLTGKNVRVSEHRGEVVVVSFWSGSCNTCRAQLEALDRIARTYASAGLTVIGVNLDDNVARAVKFARAQDVQFQLLIAAPEGTGRDYRVDRLPMMVFVDREGVLRGAHREFKARDEAQYVRELRTLLDE